MINAYVRCGELAQAKRVLIKEMKDANVEPNEVFLNFNSSNFVSSNFLSN